jgi:hypothetical protein
MARKPAALARELLRNFPKGRRGSKRRRRKPGSGSGAPESTEPESAETLETQDGPPPEGTDDERDGAEPDRDDDEDGHDDDPGPEANVEPLDSDHDEDDTEAAA